MVRGGVIERRVASRELTCVGARALRCALVAALAGTACAGGAERVPRSRWNVVLISADTLRADRLNCYGYAQRRVTPHIDALAREGILFENHIASSPWTTPSHLSLLTSLRPSSHGVTSSFTMLMSRAEKGMTVDRLPDARLTLAEALAASGRQTAAFTGGLTLDPRFGFDQGFARYETATRTLRPRNVQPLYDWIDGNRDRPFFLFWHTFEVHAPYLETAFLDEVLPEEAASRLKRGMARATRAWMQEPQSATEQAALLDRLQAYTLPVCEALYTGGVQSMDRWVGQLVRHLRDRGLYDRTLIVLTSDHGEQLGERGVDTEAGGRGFYNLHGHTLYDELLRVPLVLKLPYQDHADTRVRAVTDAIDVMPTVLDALGLQMPEEMQGMSLRGLWEGRAWPPRLAVSESLSSRHEKKAVRSDRYKYIVSTTAEEVDRHGRAFIPEHPSARELYDLRSDPGEKVNLLAGPAARRPGAEEALDRALRQAVAARGASDKATLSATTVEELKALATCSDSGHEAARVVPVRGVLAEVVAQHRIDLRVPAPQLARSLEEGFHRHGQELDPAFLAARVDHRLSAPHPFHLALGEGHAFAAPGLVETASATANAIGTPRSNLYKKLEQYAVSQEKDG